MKLIVITPENNVADETAIVNELFGAGLERLHVRKPAFNITELAAYIVAIDSRYHARVVIHSNFELLDEMGVGGIHLSSYARADKAVWQTISSTAPSLISTSFHSWQEIENNEFEYGYVFISPVFDSISKEGYRAAIDMDGARHVKEPLAQKNKYCPEIMGLGGVGIEQLTMLHNSGFDGAAMLGAVWSAVSPVSVMKEAVDIVNLLK